MYENDLKCMKMLLGVQHKGFELQMKFRYMLCFLSTKEAAEERSHKFTSSGLLKPGGSRKT